MTAEKVRFHVEKTPRSISPPADQSTSSLNLEIFEHCTSGSHVKFKRKKRLMKRSRPPGLHSVPEWREYEEAAEKDVHIDGEAQASSKRNQLIVELLEEMERHKQDSQKNVCKRFIVSKPKNGLESSNMNYGSKISFRQQLSQTSSATNTKSDSCVFPNSSMKPTEREETCQNQLHDKHTIYADSLDSSSHPINTKKDQQPFGHITSNRSCMKPPHRPEKLFITGTDSHSMNSTNKAFLQASRIMCVREVDVCADTAYQRPIFHSDLHERSSTIPPNTTNHNDKVCDNHEQLINTTQISFNPLYHTSSERPISTRRNVDGDLPRYQLLSIQDDSIGYSRSRLDKCSPRHSKQSPVNSSKTRRLSQNDENRKMRLMEAMLDHLILAHSS